MNIYAATRKGIEKGISEDRILIDNQILNDASIEIRNIKYPFIAAVADGVGGNKGGADAAQFIIEGIKASKFHEGISINLILQELEKINKKLIDRASTQDGKEKMATTLTGIICMNEKGFIFHIGNGRICCKQGNYLKQLTQDHTTYNWAKKVGNMELAQYCNKSEIVGCMGGGDVSFFEYMQVFTIENMENVRMILLTTDGVHDYVNIDCLEQHICGKEIKREVCNNIIDLAVCQGSKDDISIIIIENL